MPVETNHLTYLSQVIQKVGLCIGFYDLLESSDGLIGHGTGLVNVNGTLQKWIITSGVSC